jgi:hypothetical protein
MMVAIPDIRVAACLQQKPSGKSMTEPVHMYICMSVCMYVEINKKTHRFFELILLYVFTSFTYQSYGILYFDR